MRCKVCDTDPAEFYKGVLSRCRECHKAAMRSNRKGNLDYYRAYDARRFQDDPKVRERHRRYRATERGRAAADAAKARWKEKNASKSAAHQVVAIAVRSGWLVKPARCSRCGAGGRIHAHHEDYSQPLEVLWLCPPCHTAAHQGGARGAA